MIDRQFPQWISLILLTVAMLRFLWLVRRGVLSWRVALLALTGIFANWIFYFYVLVLYPAVNVFEDNGDFSAWRSMVTAVVAVVYGFYFEVKRRG